MAQPHDPERKTDRQQQVHGVVRREMGSAGALLCTPSDYAKFVVGVIDPKPRHCLSAETGQRQRDAPSPDVKLEEGRYPASWALGWQVFHNADSDFIFHGGDNAGFHPSAVASVAGRSGYVAMTNGENGSWALTQPAHVRLDSKVPRRLAACWKTRPEGYGSTMWRSSATESKCLRLNVSRSAALPWRADAAMSAS